jgi:WD40 repeat protein/tRNA A-37 threonylcarbamoyl transferase component Bud32
MTEETIFALALEKKSPAERSAYLREACGGDEKLRQRVEALLGSHEAASGFLNQPAFEQMAGGRSQPATMAESSARRSPESRLSASNASSVATLGPAEAPALPRGTTVRYIGDYELLEEMARGGMGVVYRARQISLERIVAVKMILAGQFASAAEVQRFRREAEAAANLDHPNIVPIYEVGEHDGQHYFSMKLVQGQSLANWIADCKLPNGDLQKNQHSGMARLIVTVARAVHHAHQRGILHRDLKPANILLQTDQCAIGKLQSAIPLVTDFGLAKRLEDGKALTHSGATVGTPSYMAPEQAGGRKDVSIAADVYSLGAILYELLTGRPPFQAATTLDVLLQVLEREPVRLRLLNPHVNSDLETICLKCLEKNPARRYRSAEALAEDLERWLAGEPILARPSTAWERAWKWVKRRPTAAALTAVSVAAVLSIAVLLAVLWKHAEARVLLEQEHGRQLGEQADKERELNKKLQVQAKELRERADAEKRLAAEVQVRAKELQGSNEVLSQERRRGDRNLYAARVNLMEQAAKEGNTLRLHELLDAERPRAGEEDHRGFEWFHFWRSSHQERLTAAAQSSVAAIAQDGRTIATLQPKGAVKLWTVETGRHVLLPGLVNAYNEGEGSLPCSLALAPDSSLLVTAWHQSVLLYDAAQRKEVARLPGHQATVGAVVFSRDGKQLASADWKGQVILWDLVKRSPRVQWQAHRSPVLQLSFTADGKTLITQTGDGERKWWETGTGKPRPIPVPGKGQILREAATPDGRFLAVGRTALDVPVFGSLVGGIATVAQELYEDEVILPNLISEVVLVEAVAGAHSKMPAMPGKVSAVLFSPDGKALACASVGGPELTVFGKMSERFRERSGQLRLWDVAGKHQRTAVEFSGGVWAGAFSPDSRKLAVAVGPFGEIRIVDVQSGKETGTHFRGHIAPVYRLSFSADGKRLFSLSRDRTVKVWEVDTVPEPSILPPRAASATFWVKSPPAFNPTGEEILVGDGNDTALVNQMTQTRRKPPGSGWFDHAVFSGDGRHIVSAGEPLFGPYIYVRDANSLKVVNQLKTSAWLDRPALLAVSPDDRFVASIGDTGKNEATIWSLANKRPVATLRPKDAMYEILCLKFSPDSKTLAMGRLGREILLWDTASWKERPALRGFAHGTSSLVFSGDGRFLAAGSGMGNPAVTSWRSGEVKLWDATTWKEIAHLTGHTAGVPALAFAPDGRTLATGSYDQTVRLWHGQTGQFLARLSGVSKPVTGLAFHPQGTSLVAVCLDGTILQWHAATKTAVRDADRGGR